MAQRQVLVLIVAFTLSVLVRLPLLDRPLSAHHEFCTALVLTILHNWQGEGFVALDGGPAITFTGAADRYPAGWSDLPGQRDGLLFYFSHPPLAYDLPHVLFSSLRMAPDVLGLQLFNLFFHLVTTMALYLAVREAGNGPEWERAGLFAAVLYLFMPAPLWFHSNAYMSDMFVQSFWVLHLAVMMRLFTGHARLDRSQLFWSGLTLFLAVYTSWLGVFAGAATVVVALSRWWRSRSADMVQVAMVATVAMLGALLLMLWRYGQVVGFEGVIAYLRSRAEVRSTMGLEPGLLHYLFQLVENYRTGYLPVIALLVVLTVLLRKRFPVPGRQGAIGLFVVLTTMPVLLDHLLLLEYAQHDFAALKAGPVLCGLAGLGLSQIPLKWGRVALALTAVAGVAYFMRLNPLPGEDDGRYAWERDIGTAIAATVSPEQAVFFLGYTPEPQVAWYAKRTIFRIDDLEQARSFLIDQGSPSGVIFRLDEGVLRHELIQRPE
jgi:hypothetical protein